MDLGYTINIIRIWLLFFILLTGILSIVINERKKKILAKRRNYDTIIKSLVHQEKAGKRKEDTTSLRSKEINVIAAIIALKGGIRSLAVVLGVLCILFVLIEIYRITLD